MAKWKAQHFGASTKESAAGETHAIEEIKMVGAYGTDTGVLEADVMRAAREMDRKK